MKKVGIITINDNNNYGNRLQNYALYSVLHSMGVDAQNIENYIFFNNKRLYRLKKIRHMFFSRTYSSNSKKKANFCVFNHNIAYYPGLFSPLKKYDDLDYVICGSDQVWNPMFALSDCTILSTFPGKKRISYAASFGITDIPETEVNVYKSEIPKYKALSVREEAGAKIIKNLTGRDAEILVDPTLLLNREEWRKVSKKPNGVRNGYILTYFLSPKCDAAKAKLEEIRSGREVYELMDPNDMVAGVAGPSEFLWLFDHADLILTDSFHACVFSFLFNKPFVVYDRNWENNCMNSRLETLLKKFDIERKYAGSELENDLFEHDYTVGYKQLELERKKSMEFLKKALED